MRPNPIMMADGQFHDTLDTVARCEACRLTYEVDFRGEPVTAFPYTCDDCGGLVEKAEARP